MFPKIKVLSILPKLMDSLWLKILLFCLLLTLILSPFAGFAPLLIFLLVAGTWWIVQSILQALITGETSE